VADPSYGPPDTCLQPDPVAAVVAYLTGVATVAALVDDRVASALDTETAWPAVRVTLLSSFPVYPRVLDRHLFQVDCFATDEPAAYQLAATVRAALVGCGGWVGAGAVLTGSTDLSLRPIPDETYTPPISRVAVAGYVFARPDPREVTPNGNQP